MTNSSFTLKFCGHGPNGTPAYAVLNARREYQPDTDGQILLNRAKAAALLARLSA
jgi:hypothetical protein